MYPVAIAASLLTVLCLEMMHFINLHFSEKVVEITLVPDSPFRLTALPSRLKAAKMHIERYTVSEGKVHLALRMRHKDYLSAIQRLMETLEGFSMEEMN